MDRKLSETQEIQRLIRLSAVSRSMLESETCALRNRLDLPARIRNSLKERPTTWMFGALASGLAASMMFHRRPTVERKRRGFPATLLGLTLTAARPLAKVWLANQLKDWVTGSSAHVAASLLQSRPSSTSKSL